MRFDRLYFESETAEPGKKAAEDLLKKGIAKKDQGAVIVDLKEKGLGVVVLLTTEVYPLYSAKELALAQMEFTEFKIDSCVHVVANEQTLHFNKVNEILKKYKPEWASANIHLPYELVNLPTGKMSSRTGNVIAYEDLLGELIQKALEETKPRHTDWPEKKLNATARSIAFAAIRYSMLKPDNNKVIVFDINRAVALQGDTGPYLQYTHARASSILEKAKTKSQKLPKNAAVKEHTEKKLLKQISKLPSALVSSATQNRPSMVASYAYDLAVAFNEFYEKCPVLSSEGDVRATRLAIVSAAKQTLKNTLMLLGIDALEEM